VRNGAVTKVDCASSPLNTLVATSGSRLPLASIGATISTFCAFAGNVRTASFVLNSKYCPGLRMLDGILSKEIFGLDII
jgi:hypothetical protein